MQLVCAYGFDVAGLQVIRWRAVVGNWASRRVAAKVGFIFDGTVRRLLVHRGELLDGWIATLTRDDPRVPQPWLDPVEMRGRGVRLRAFRDSDVGRIVEACSDARTSYWLVSMPQPYRSDNALAYLEATAEMAARGAGLAWCIADPKDDRCLGSISLDGLGGYSQRGEIGYWAHPDARGRGVVTRGRSTGDGACKGIRTGHIAADSLRLQQHSVATSSRAGGISGNWDPACLGTFGDGALADLVLYSRPIARPKGGYPPATPPQYELSVSCGIICG